MKNMHITTIT